MGISIQLKRSLADPLLFLIKLRNYLSERNRSAFVILMYHRILEKEGPCTYLQDAMYVNPSTFRSHMEYVRENFQVLPLRSIPGRMASRQNGGNKPLCFLTFDDGWSDFYTNAYPVLKKMDLPATVFLPTDLIGTDKSLWTDRIARLLIEKERKSNLGREGARRTNAAIEHSIERLKSRPMEQIERLIEEWARDWGVEPFTMERSFLSWEETKEIHRSGIIEFGSHSRTHRILTTATDDEVQDELIRSRKMLVEQGVASPGFIPFAYPNGNYSVPIEKIVEESGYRMAVTTQSGWNRIADYGANCYRLKRIGIHQDVASSNAMFACRIEGIY